MVKNRVGVNIVYLTVFQVSNYIFPIILIPFLVKTIGLPGIGVVDYFASIALYFSTIVLFGFDYSATREVSIKRDSLEGLRCIFVKVFSIRIYLFLILSICYFLLFFIFKDFNEFRGVAIINYILVLSAVFQPWWFYQGLEQLKQVSISLFLIKLIATLSIIVIVKSEQDIYLVVLSNVLPNLLFSVFHFCRIKKNYGVVLELLPLKKVVNEIKKAFYLMANEVSILFFTSANIIVLGTVLGADQIGELSLALRILVVIQSVLIVPFQKSVFPFLAKTISESTEKFISLLLKVRNVLILVMALASLGMYFVLPFFVGYVLPEEANVDLVTEMLQYLSVMPLLIGIANIYGWQGLINIKKEKTLFYIVSFIGSLSILALYFFSLEFGQIGGVYVRVSVELILALSCFIFFKKEVKNSIL